ncbi:Panacea domain-containing protein [Alkalicoccobacillus gibsonii]|uniref:Panacea domain-containing protein n=1 Tax=Alkalicoccobacillus gibsonii TaxID=79881 RepID=UPI001932C69D|nr:type II toxin-antitoxin system antitoxin SocA domain-containing protein [Alkalicoccobacillus gibsonii]MBM0064909.1 DUF4065 domain-containing protein [Alkalicoccobacillus gibsonii]
MTMQALAGHIFAVANETGRSITNLQLQKILFFSLGLHLRLRGGIDQLAQEIYNLPFSKWRYGPVVEDLYFTYNGYGSQPIIPQVANRDPRFEHLDTAIINLLDRDVFKLVSFSHQMSAWDDFKDDILEGRHVDPYTLDEIFTDFTE